MNPVALFFASGESLYPGAVLLMASVIAGQSSRPLIPRLGRIATWIGLALVIMACPPLAWWLSALLGLAFLLWTISRLTTSHVRGWDTFRKSAASLFIVLLAGITAVEYVHRRLPRIHGEKSDHLVVLGDSISAGLGTQQSPWPEVMKKATGSNIINLSLPGATVPQAMGIANHLSAHDQLVLVELGGNDMLSGEPASEFGRSLDKLLAKLSLPGRTVVMFELPLLPQRIGFGREQRRLANQYGVWLIPKRFLARVISGRNAASDGLHLSETGARRMASLVSGVLRPVLQLDSSGSTTPATHP